MTHRQEGAAATAAGCTALQEQLLDTLRHRRWDAAERLAAEYGAEVARLTPEGIPPEELRHIAIEHRRMVRLLREAAARTRDDIDNLARGIARLERGRRMLAAATEG
ncbi:MAG: hypothetical protein D6682_04775 [Zetaproteobacteria bacterium]|nr:MAG: hypothetical protein D6682_04775 [Zetaproteobacteria bacterium]